MSARLLCIAVHDVAPATRHECAALLRMLDALGCNRVTLAVVPRFHGQAAIFADRELVDMLGARVARGAEVALHGDTHLDRGAPPRSLGDRFRRQVLTDGEGEFAALPRRDAARKLRHGTLALEGLGWNVQGFIPPAWLCSQGTRHALRDTRIRYYSTHTHLVDVASGRKIPAPCATASARTALRRLCSGVWLSAFARHAGRMAIVRIALHPADARSPEIMSRWQQLIPVLMRGRETVCKREAVASVAGATWP